MVERHLFCIAWRCEDFVADRIVNELGERMQAKLDHDFRPMRLDRPDGDSQPGSDLLIRFSLRQQSNYFNFTGGWSGWRMLRRVRFLPRREESLHYDVGYSGGQKHLTRRNMFHRFYKVRCKIGF